MRETIQNANGKQFHAVSLSGGKDSTAMLLLMIERDMPIDDLSEAALSIPAIDVVMERQHEKSERCRMASTMVSQIRDKLTETQFRRLWMYYVGGMTVDEIGRIEGIRHQNISKSIGSAMKKIKKFFP